MIYAIGDVHGRNDLLGQLHDHIKDFHALQYARPPAQLIHVGDYIDGGARSVQVIAQRQTGSHG